MTLATHGLAALALVVGITAAAVRPAGRPTVLARATPAAEEGREEGTAPCLREDAPKPRRVVSFGVLNSRAIEIPKPAYPGAARAAKVSGTVKVGVVVDEGGRVVWARIHSGHPLLRAAVRDVVCRARFKPVRLSGTPVAVNGIISYNFVLD